MKRLLSIRHTISIALAFAFPVVAWSILPAESPLRGQVRTDPAAVIDTIDSSRVMGAQSCADCHEQESLSLHAGQHYKSDQRIRKFEGNTKKYCEALGITAEQLRTESVCLKCHTTVQSGTGAGTKNISGVSCESCHGPAGGDEGWLNIHAVFGANGTTSEDETPEHRTMRRKRCAEAGMRRAEDIRAMAANCYRCHLIDLPELFAAGHPAGSNGFEFVRWTSGEQRHNFLLNRAVNAAGPSRLLKETGRTPQEHQRLKYVVGALVELEMSLRIRARAVAAPDVDFAAQMGARVAVLNRKLTAISAAAPEIVPAVAFLGPIMERVFLGKPDDATFYEDAADKVANVTTEFLENHDGSKLEAVDALIATRPARGTPFAP